MTVTAGSSKTGLPAIQDLSSSVSLGVTTIAWKVAEEQVGTFQFGLWFSLTSPVDTTGSPDQVVPFYPGVGDYQAARKQVGAEYVAVATFSGAETGPLADLYLPWVTGPLPSPADQAYTGKLSVCR